MKGYIILLHFMILSYIIFYVWRWFVFRLLWSHTISTTVSIFLRRTQEQRYHTIKQRYLTEYIFEKIKRDNRLGQIFVTWSGFLICNSTQNTKYYLYLCDILVWFVWKILSENNYSVMAIFVQTLKIALSYYIL